MDKKNNFSKVLKVLHLLDSTNRGGAEILMLDLCRNTSKEEFEVILVVTGKGSLLNDFENSGVKCIFLERKMPIDLGLVFQLKKIVDENNISIIHGHQAVDGLHAYLTSVFTGVKTVMSFHGHIPSKKNDIILKLLIPRVDANIAVSFSFLKRLKEEIKFNIGKNFHVIYNGIDTRKFFKTERNLRKELNLSETDLLIGMVGNFNSTGRDHITVCKALPNLFKKFQNLHFVFVGNNAEENSQYKQCHAYCQENRITDKTHFVGSRTDINSILNSLDIFVYSSNHDTFGIAVIEAMISGLPVIINDLSTLLEVTNNGKYASVFKSKSPEDLGKRITELIENELLRRALSKSGAEWALSQFAIEKYIINLKKLYLNILQMS